jgi:hypothetical protein
MADHTPIPEQRDDACQALPILYRFGAKCVRSASQEGIPMEIPTVSGPMDLPKEFPRQDQRLRDTAQRLEAAFLSEMLRHAGAVSARETFGGGIGEAQFASFLRDLEAQAIADAGGLGLAEAFFHALKGRADA